MSILMSSGRGRGRKHLGGSGGSPAGTIVAAQAKRHKGANGAATAVIMCPVPEGYISGQADLDSVIVRVNGVEMAVELVARGRHPSGDFQTVQGWVSIASIAAGSPIACEIEFGGTPSVARTNVGGHYAYARNGADPRLAGYPDVTITPTSAAYLATTKLTGPYALQTRADTMALGGRYAVYWHRIEDFSAWWWNANAGSGPNGTAPAADNPLCWQHCNTGNTAFGGYGDLTVSSSDFQNWRVAAAYVGSAYPGNAYDLGKAHIEWWLASADTTYLIRGLSFIAHYAKEFIHFQTTGVNGFAAFPDGCAAYTLLTGDPAGNDAVEIMADRFFRAVPGYFATGAGSIGVGYAAFNADANGTERGKDPREHARIMQTAHAGYRLRTTTSWDLTTRRACDYAAFAVECKNRALLTPGDGILRRSDGTFRNVRCTDAASPSMALNAFMNPMLALELIKHYEMFGADSAVLTAVQDMWDWMYANLWGIWDYSFNGTDWFTSTIKTFRQAFENDCAALDSPHPNAGDAGPLVLMYPAVAAWLYAKGAGATYKTQADDVINEGIGTGTTRGVGPTIGETGGGGLASRKGFGEAYHAMGPALWWRLA